jgi:hypothetical protein
MALRYEHLDDVTRALMIEEIQIDEAADRLYRSSYLSQSGQGNWADMLLEAARQGTDDPRILSRRIQKIKTRGIWYMCADVQKPDGRESRNRNCYYSGRPVHCFGKERRNYCIPS